MAAPHERHPADATSMARAPRRAATKAVPERATAAPAAATKIAAWGIRS